MCFVTYSMRELQSEKRRETETETEREGEGKKKRQIQLRENKSLSSPPPCQRGTAAARGHLARWAQAGITAIELWLVAMGKQATQQTEAELG